MKITTGLFDHMVLQRNRRNRSDTLVTGEAAAAGTVLMRTIPENGRWRAVGRVERGHFRFRLSGLRAGGPYKVELQIRRGRTVVDRLQVRDILVGDVWRAGGQSNMQGCGRRESAAAPQLDSQFQGYFAMWYRHTILFLKYADELGMIDDNHCTLVW